MIQNIKQTAQFLASKWKNQPEIGIVLGTGLGNLSDEIEVEASIPYQNIPHFPISTVSGHSGNLIYGKLGGKYVLAMQGRFHYYEGHSMAEVVFPIRVMKQLGINYLVVSNASGGVNPEFEIGDIMVISDHINLFPTNPLMGRNYKELGPRFPDMSEAYDKSLIKKAFNIAEKQGVKLQKGVYVGLSGPTLETPAEYKYIRIIGGDAVGMSTVPEIIAARHMDMKCFAFSIITDLGVEGRIEKTTHEMIKNVGEEQEPKMRALIRELIEQV